MRTCVVLVALVILSATLSRTQDREQHPSSRSSASCEFDDSKVIRTDYSSAPRKGRKIFGGLVPYGKVWPAETNQAATLISDADLSVAGKEIPAGSYTLFTLPAAGKWMLIISKLPGEPRTPYSEGEDVLRADMKVTKTPAPVENFTIAYHKIDATCSITLSWEDTEATLDLKEKKLCWPTTSPLTYSCPDQ